MSFAFGATSMARLEQVAEPLREVFVSALATQIIDIAIITGHRGRDEQNAAFASKATGLRWPMSRHNSLPSMAVDAAPYPIRWGDRGDPSRVKAIGAFYLMAGVVLATASRLGVPIRWGGDWDGDGDIYDQTFDDLVHFELVNP